MIRLFLFFVIFLSPHSYGERGDRQKYLDEIDGIIEEARADFSHEALQKEGLKFDLNSLKDPKLYKLVSDQFEQSKISSQSLDQKINLFNEYFDGTPLAETLNKLPRVKRVVVDILTDKDSVLGLLSIFQKEKERMYALYVFIGSIVLSIILKIIFISKSNGFLLRLVKRVFINILCVSITFGIYFYLFEKELGPILKIINKHF